jgi:hypothetical protein
MAASVCGPCGALGGGSSGAGSGPARIPSRTAAGASDAGASPASAAFAAIFALQSIRVIGCYGPRAQPFCGRCHQPCVPSSTSRVKQEKTAAIWRPSLLFVLNHDHGCRLAGRSCWAFAADHESTTSFLCTVRFMLVGGTFLSPPFELGLAEERLLRRHAPSNGDEPRHGACGCWRRGCTQRGRCHRTAKVDADSQLPPMFALREQSTARTAVRLARAAVTAIRTTLPGASRRRSRVHTSQPAPHVATKSKFPSQTPSACDACPLVHRKLVCSGRRPGSWSVAWRGSCARHAAWCLVTHRPFPITGAANG